MLSLVDLHSSWSSPGLVPLSGARHHPPTQSGRNRSTHPHSSRFQPGVICVEEVPPSEGFPHHPSVRALTKACGLYLLNSIYFETADYGDKAAKSGIEEDFRIAVLIQKSRTLWDRLWAFVFLFCCGGEAFLGDAST
jgi:hypothetical protein